MLLSFISLALHHYCEGFSEVSWICHLCLTFFICLVDSHFQRALVKNGAIGWVLTFTSCPQKCKIYKSKLNLTFRAGQKSFLNVVKFVTIWHTEYTIGQTLSRLLQAIQAGLSSAQPQAEAVSLEFWLVFVYICNFDFCHGPSLVLRASFIGGHLHFIHSKFQEDLISGCWDIQFNIFKSSYIEDHLHF